MAVELEFYLVEELTGVKTKIDNILDLGSIFKGTEKKVPIAIYNAGTETAVSPKVRFTQYMQDGSDYYEALTWKTLAEDKYAEFVTSLQLPDIQPKSWLAGKSVQYENFNSYPPIRTALDNESWWVDEGLAGTWKTYSGYIEHGEDTQTGRCFWRALKSAKDFEFSTRITVRNGSYAGYILRDTGDHDTGYIALVQGIPSYFTGNMTLSEGIIQVWKGKFSSGLSTWTLLGSSTSVGQRGTHDFFKVAVSTLVEGGVEKTRLDFWYNNELSDTPIWSFIDSNGTYKNAAIPVLCADTSANDNLIYFDDIKMETPTTEGRIWFRDNVVKATQKFGRQFTVFKVEFGGV